MFSEKSPSLKNELIPLLLPEVYRGDEQLYPQFMSKLACGLFGISDDFIEKYQSLDALFIKNKHSTFFFEAAGNSMEPTIFAGDILIVDRARTDFHGRICVVCFEDKLLCKRVIKKSDGIILKSDNPHFKNIIIENNDNIQFWGVVIAHASFVK